MKGQFLTWLNSTEGERKHKSVPKHSQGAHRHDRHLYMRLQCSPDSICRST